MSAKHLPGPWFVANLDAFPSVAICFESSHGNTGPDPEPPCSEPICELWNPSAGPPSPEIVATANVMAAAPDLIEALEDCDRAFANWQVGQVPGRPEDILALIQKTRAALAKARGTA